MCFLSCLYQAGLADSCVSYSANFFEGPYVALPPISWTVIAEPKLTPAWSAPRDFERLLLTFRMIWSASRRTGEVSVKRFYLTVEANWLFKSSTSIFLYVEF